MKTFTAALTPSGKRELKGFELIDENYIDTYEGERMHIYTIIDFDPSQYNQVLGVTKSGEVVDMGCE